MKRFKKLFALIMALSFLVLSACSGSPETSVPTDPDRTVPETTVPTIPEITVRTSPISSEYFWLTARGDNAFLGRSDGIGNFNGALQELWSADITEGSLPAVYIADLDGDKKNEVIYSYCGCLYAVKQEGGLFWKSNKMGESYIFGVKNVGPDAKAALVTLFGKNIVILDLLTGETLYKSDFEVDFFSALYLMQLSFADFDGKDGDEIVTYTDQNTIRVISFANGFDSPETVREYTYNTFKDYIPSFALGDYNNDGQTDVFFAGYGMVGVFDGKSENLASSVKFTPGGTKYGNGRTYGQFYAKDVNGDGFCDAVVISYSLNEHVEVIVSDGESLSKKFLVFYEFDAGPNGNNKSLVSLTDSLVDVTGSGSYRLVYSTYNGDGESEKWETHIMRADAKDDDEATTTEQIIENTYLRGILDLDGDGINELILSKETTLSASTYPEIYVYKFDKTEYKKIVSYDKAYVLKNDFIRSESYHCCYDPERIRAISLMLDTPAFAVKTSDGKYLALSLVNGDLTAVAEYDGKPVYAADLDGDGKSEVFTLVDNKCKVIGGDTVKLSFDIGTSVYQTPVAADIDGDGTLEVVVAGATKVALYKVNARGATLSWQTDGYGSRYDRQSRSAVIADMGHGIGYKIIVGGYDENTGESRIRVLNADGSEDWGYTFKGYYAEFSNTKSGIYQFITGDFNGDGYTDIAVFLIKGSKPLGSNYTEMTNIIDGDTHGLMFSDSELIGKVSPGSVPSNATAADIDDDGCDEIFMTALNYFCSYEYVAGRIERFYQFTRNDYDFYYGTPIPVKTSEGYKLFLSDGYYGFLLIDPDASRDYYTKYEKYESNFYRLSGIGNFDKDDNLEFAIQIAGKGIVIHDLLTGKEEKTIETDPNTFSILTADIDSDTIDEIIYTTPTGSLYILDTVTTAVTEYVFNSSVSDVIITDSNGDDIIDLIVIGSDGKMYGLGSTKA